MAEPTVKSDGSGGYTFSWDHNIDSPHMEIIGSVGSDGTYSVRFYKHGTGKFGYTFNIKVNDTSILSYAVGDIKEDVNIDTTKSGTVSTGAFKLVAVCGDTGCDNGASGSGKTIIDVSLYTAPSVGSLSVTSKTTRSITVKATWTEGSATSTATVNLGNQSGSISSSGSTCTFDYLTHNKSYTISGSLSDGTTTANYTSISSSTKKLGCTYDTTSAKQYSISANFYATVDDAKYPTQSGISCSTAELQNSSGTWLQNLTTFSGTYGTISASGLTSYTTYKLKCSITDGSNTVSNTATLTTIFPYARIKVNGVWKKAMPYVNVNGYWKLAKPYVKNSGGEWKECNGED